MGRVVVPYSPLCLRGLKQLAYGGLMGLQRGSQSSVPLQKENHLCLPEPFAICNYPNPALHPPCSLSDLRVKNGAVGMHCNSGFKEQMHYVHGIPALLRLFPSENEENRAKERQG